MYTYRQVSPATSDLAVPPECHDVPEARSSSGDDRAPALGAWHWHLRYRVEETDDGFSGEEGTFTEDERHSASATVALGPGPTTGPAGER
jgi:hypothetical protein